MNFYPRTVIKGQTLVDFIAKFTYSKVAKITRTANNSEVAKAAGVKEREKFIPIEGDAEQWTLYVDGAFNSTGSGVDMMLISPEGHKIHCAICFAFKTSNNEGREVLYV